MHLTRRDFLIGAAAAGPLASVFRSNGHAQQSASAPASRAAAKRSILILGGTGFLGPALVASARARGHALTLFNRGKTRPGLFPDIETLHGDRDGDLKSLEGRRWDAVIDTSGYVPRIVRASTDLLHESGHYVFISSVSVYPGPRGANLDESSPVETLDDPTIETMGERFERYGALKALCEQAVEKALPGRATTIRPGLIVGPEDPSDRFTYWPVRVARGGEVLAPGAPSDPIQVIDVRDLAAWTIAVIERGAHGTFNAVSPPGALTIGALMEACNAAGGKKATFAWGDAAFLAEQRVAPWSDMPVWFPAHGDPPSFGSASSKRAVALGLAFRPLEDTARDTLAWWRTLPAERQAKLKSGIKPEREAEVLAALKKRG